MILTQIIGADCDWTPADAGNCSGTVCILPIDITGW